MKNWQFWIIVILLTLNLFAVVHLGSEESALFKQVHWITWKLDQRGSEKIQIDADK